MSCENLSVIDVGMFAKPLISNFPERNQADVVGYFFRFSFLSFLITNSDTLTHTQTHYVLSSQGSYI